VGLVAIFLSGLVLAYQPAAALGIVGAVVLLVCTGLFLRLGPEWRGVLPLAAVAFLLTGYPVARVVIGGMPLYMTDVLIVLALLAAFAGERPNWRIVQPLPLLVLAYILLTVLSSIREIWLTGVLPQPLYMLLRFTLSMSLALLVPVLVRKAKHTKVLAVGLILGMSLTAAVALTMSLPIGNNPMREVVYPALYPINEGRYEFEYSDDGSPLRGTSLAGVATSTAHVITLVWPLALGLYMTSAFGGQPRWLLLVLALGAMGLASTYSRAAYLGIALVLAVAFATHKGAKWRYVVAMVLLLIIVLAVAQSMGLIRLDYAQARFVTLVEEPTHRASQSRAAAYRDIIPYLRSHPLWLVVGRGLAWTKLAGRELIDQSDWLGVFGTTQEHSAWAIVMYQRGALAAAVLTLAVLTAFLQIRRSPSLHSTSSSFLRGLPRSLQLVFIAIVPAWLVSHFFGDIIHGQSLLFLYLGFVMALCQPALASSEESPAGPQA
jgi:hypothetical protein